MRTANRTKSPILFASAVPSAALLLLLPLGAMVATAQSIPSPERQFGHVIGADRSGG